MFEISIESLYDAFFDTNRLTKDMIPFSLRIDEEIFKLWKELRAGTYEISRTKAFIVKEPKKREIFAMHPRDKIVNHWVRLRIEPILERYFSDGCYSCRKGKGGGAFVKDARQKIEEITAWHGTCFLAHLDIENFFMSIPRALALKKVSEKVAADYWEDDRDLLLWLLEKIFLYAPEKNYYICGDPEDWDGYPPEKSLITNEPGNGLMMGSVNSQIVANLVLTDSDRYIESLGIVVFRYVDDLLLLHHDKAYLLGCVQKIEDFIFADTGLRVHKKKRYFQDARKGVKIIGYVIKDGRVYLANRCRGNMDKRIFAFNRWMEESPRKAARQARKFVACVNSYLGRTADCRAYNIRKRAWEQIGLEWKRLVTGCNSLLKIKLKNHENAVIKI